MRNFPIPCLFALFAVLSTPHPAGGADNLLVITVDTLRADRVGAYGGRTAATPAMDRLAREGVLFSRAFAHAPLTLPSHCSLFTGVLPPGHGVRTNGRRLSAGSATLAEILRAKGYRTAAFVGAFPLDSRFGLDRGFDVYDDEYGSRNPVRDMAFVERGAGAVNAAALAWLDQREAAPFFMWVHYFDPHAPYAPPPPFARIYQGREYDGEIAYVDQAVGELIDRLERRDLLDHTLVVLTSDHGEGLGEHGESTHGIFIYDSTLHVPLIFRRSGLPADRRVDVPVRLVDVLPTILDLLGLPPAEPARDGISLTPAFSGRGRIPANACYLESLAPLLDRNWAPLSGLRTGEWKYIRAPEPELYDLVSDPGEKHNLHNERPEVARRLRAELERTVELAFRPEAPAPSVEAAPAADEVRRKLATLGYVSGGYRQGEGARPDPKRMIDLDNRFNRAIDLSESGDLENAAALYRGVLEEQPDFIVGYEFAAYNLYKMGKPAEAVVLLERALARGLDSPTLQARLGLYYQETDRLDQSVQLLERTVRENGTYAEAHNYLGISYYRSGRLADAVNSFRLAITLDGSYAMAMNNLGNCLLAQEDFDRAAETYRAALKVDDRLAAAWNGLGVVLYRKGGTAEAVSLWEKAVALDGGQADTLYNLGKTLLGLGREAEALRYLEMFLEVASPVRYARDIQNVQAVIKRIKREHAAARSAGAGGMAG